MTASVTNQALLESLSEDNVKKLSLAGVSPIQVWTKIVEVRATTPTISTAKLTVEVSRLLGKDLKQSVISSISTEGRKLSALICDDTPTTYVEPDQTVATDPPETARADDPPQDILASVLPETGLADGPPIDVVTSDPPQDRIEDSPPRLVFAADLLPVDCEANAVSADSAFVSGDPPSALPDADEIAAADQHPPIQHAPPDGPPPLGDEPVAPTPVAADHDRGRTEPEPVNSDPASHTAPAVPPSQFRRDSRRPTESPPRQTTAPSSPPPRANREDEVPPTPHPRHLPARPSPHSEPRRNHSHAAPAAPSVNYSDSASLVRAFREDQERGRERGGGRSSGVFDLKERFRWIKSARGASIVAILLIISALCLVAFLFFASRPR